MKFEAKLISLDDFKVVNTFEFDDKEYPFNDENYKHLSNELLKSNVSQIQSNYLWVTQKMFPNHLIIDKQNNNSLERGHPDFIAIDGKVRVIKFIEFKGVSDILSAQQISWFYKNYKKKRFIIKLEECASIYLFG